MPLSVQLAHSCITGLLTFASVCKIRARVWENETGKQGVEQALRRFAVTVVRERVPDRRVSRARAHTRTVRSLFTLVFPARLTGD